MALPAGSSRPRGQHVVHVPLPLLLADGGAKLLLNGVAQALPSNAEYPALYARFAGLVGARARDVDLAPLRIVADAFLVAETRRV